MSRWIELIEEMPEEGRNVLFWDEELGAVIGAFMGNDFDATPIFDLDFRDGYGRTVLPTHWMPLPEGPQ